MAFLDNSGDIILDAVLTDTGRLRLAQGDGSFKITKFALGDDEINYGLYNKDHASGSAYYDLEILQTPVLEAFTNNTSNLKSRLLSISRTNILFMPTLKLNKRLGSQGGGAGENDKDSFMYGRSDVDAATTATAAPNKYIIACDETTWKVFTNNTLTGANGAGGYQGIIQGYNPGPDTVVGGSAIRVDQGLDTNVIAPTAGLDSDLVENQYIMEVDYRLGRIAEHKSQTQTDVNFIDDDNIASYYIAGGTYVRNNTNVSSSQKAEEEGDPQAFKGPRGTTLFFRLNASTELQYSTYLFEQIGTTLAKDSSKLQTVYGLKDSTRLTEFTTGNNDPKLYAIDSTIRVTGANTGFQIDVPVRYVKVQ